MSNDEECLQQIYVINLDKSVHRLARIQKNLSDLGLDFTRFVAVPGASISNLDVSPACSLVCSNGMIGCFKSHAALWSLLAKEQDEDKSMLILEDDAVITEHSLKAIRELEAMKKHGKLQYDMVNLGVPRALSYISGLFPRKCLGTLDGGGVIYSGGLALTTTAYILTSRGARMLLDHIGTKPIYHVDMTMELIMRKVPGYTRLFVLDAPIENCGANDSTLNDVTHIRTVDEQMITKNGNLGNTLWYLQLIAFSINRKYHIRLGHILAFGLLVVCQGIKTMRYRLIIVTIAVCVFLITVIPS